jgi:glycosyltransferase involved in cell wall biosynthesis
VLGEGRDNPERASVARRGSLAAGRAQLPQRFDSAQRKTRPPESRVRLVEEAWLSPERLGCREKRLGHSHPAAPETWILTEHGEVEGHDRTLSGTIVAVVGIALLTLAPRRMGGSEEYARGLTAALARYGAGEYTVVVPPDAADAAGGLPALAAGAPSSSGRPRAFAQGAFSHGALTGIDVVHYPLTVPVPLTRRPRIVTLHDVLHLDLPQLVSRRVRAFRRVAYDLAARTADRVIVPSVAVRDRAVERLGLDPERVRVIHHGVDHELFRAGSGEREQFLLYPARPWPHKNHALLFAAYAQVRRERPDLALLLTGSGHEGLTLPNGVRSLGHVPTPELASLYRRAAAVVFPSRYEGFGWPVLEAMACGCPVAAASGTAVEEIAGDVGVFFAPTSADQAAEAIRRVLDDGAALAARGINRAGVFTWERSARLHDEVYDELSLD